MQRDEGNAGGAVRQHAGRAHHQHRILERGELVLACDQPVARGEGELHRVREADDHDERRHHVQEHVEIEVGPAERTESQQDRNHRRECRRDHERYLAEEDDGDDTAGEDAKNIVGEPIPLDRVADLKLHHRHAGELHVEPGVAEVLLHQVADVGNGLGQLVGSDHLRIEREHDQRQGAVFRQQLAADDLVVLYGLDELVVRVALWQLSREQRRRQLTRGRRLTRREQRDQSTRAFDQLQVSDEIAQLLQVAPFQKGLALDHDENVELLRRELLRDLFVLAEFAGVGTEELRQRIVDLDAVDAENGADHQGKQDDAGHNRGADGDQPEPLQPEGDRGRRSLLDLVDMNLILAVLFEHALSSS